MICGYEMYMEEIFEIFFFFYKFVVKFVIEEAQTKEV